MFTLSSASRACVVLAGALLASSCRPSGTADSVDSVVQQPQATSGSAAAPDPQSEEQPPRTFGMADAWTEVPPDMLYGVVMQRPIDSPDPEQAAQHQLLTRLLQSVFGYSGASLALPRELDSLGIAPAGLIVAAWDAETHRFMSFPLRDGADADAAISQFAQLMGDAPGTGPTPATLPGFWQGDRYVYTVHRQRLYLGRLPIPLRDFLQGGSPDYAPRDPGVTLPPGADPALAVFFQPGDTAASTEWRGLESAWLWVPLAPSDDWLATGDLRWAPDAPLPAGLADGSGFAAAADDEWWISSALTPTGAQFLAALTAENRNSPISGRSLLAQLLATVQPAIPASAIAWFDGRVMMAAQSTGIRLHMGTHAPLPANALQTLRESVCSAMQGVLPEAGQTCCRENEWCATAIASEDSLLVYVALSDGQLPAERAPEHTASVSPGSDRLRAGLSFRALEWLAQMPVRDVAGLREGCGEHVLLSATQPAPDHTSVTLDLNNPASLGDCIVAMRDAVARQDARLLFAEAESNVHRISANAARVVRRWVREQGALEGVTLPADTGITPPLQAIAAACEQNFGVLNTQPILWDTAEWRDLDFILYDRHRFVYRFESEGEGETLRTTTTAWGDLDCDGVYSTWYRDASIVDGELVAGELTWVSTGDD